LLYRRRRTPTPPKPTSQTEGTTGVTVPTATVPAVVGAAAAEVAALTERTPPDQQANATSARKRPTAHGNILIRSKPKQGTNTKDSLIAAKTRTANSENASDSTLPTVKETVATNPT
jgi:hypothetical protein